MVVRRQQQTIEHFHVRDLPEILDDRDLLIVNDTKVIPAKLVGYRKATGGRWQGLFLESDDQGHWKVLAKTRGNVQIGEVIVLKDRHGADRLELLIVAKLDGGHWAVKPLADGDAEQLLQKIGRVPLPHYIRDGNMVDTDVQNYQTVFARHPGAVAAPTAGLHLTDALIDRMKRRGIQTASVTLHVGIGTFRPIKVDNVAEHEMHSEIGELSNETAYRILETKAQGGRVIAVGTTSVRVLETVARQQIAKWKGATELYIRPGFEFKVIDGLMTNFHLPRTSLLVLVRTFGTNALIKQAYAEAIEQEYRFYSYGDAMLIL